ncbi:MAG: hypothetical protein MRJ68_09250 [Nitrospira sp.]|nr:hypothetical protein [Nitrospira sp.]
MLQKYQKNTIISAVEVEENGHQKNRETFQCSRIADQWELSGNLCDWMHRDQRTAVVLAIISHCHLSSIGLDAWLIQTKESISGKTFHPRAIVFRLKEAFQIGEAIIHDILLKESMTNHTSRSAGSVS